MTEEVNPEEAIKALTDGMEFANKLVDILMEREEKRGVQAIGMVFCVASIVVTDAKRFGIPIERARRSAHEVLDKAFEYMLETYEDELSEEHDDGADDRGPQEGSGSGSRQN